MVAVGRGSPTFHWTGMKGKLEAPAPIAAFLRAKWPTGRQRSGGGKHSAAAALHSHLAFELHIKRLLEFSFFHFNASNYANFPRVYLRQIRRKARLASLQQLPGCRFHSLTQRFFVGLPAKLLRIRQTSDYISYVHLTRARPRTS